MKKNGGEEPNKGKEKETPKKEEEPNAIIISDEIDCFLSIVLSLKHDQTTSPSPPHLPVSSINKLFSSVDKDLSNNNKCLSPTLLESIDRIARLSTALSAFPTESSYTQTKTRAGVILQHAMSFLEDEFRALLEDFKSNAVPSEDERRSTPLRHYTEGTVEKLRRIADTMISAGYESECCQTFSLSRRNAFDSALSDLGIRRISIDDMQKLQWELLEREITKWIQAFRTIATSFTGECELCNSVFSQHASISSSLFGNLARDVTIQLLNFVETVVTVIHRTAEKLFRVLDIYEALRDMLLEIDAKLPSEEQATSIKSEISAAKSRLGEAAGAMFCDLQNSIKNEIARTPVPGGAVHPLTRYVMNYLELACDQYRKPLEQVFNEMPVEKQDMISLGGKVIEVMGILDANLEAKAKLYKDSALSYIFLMNNGRYIVKKIKESGEIYSLVGDGWYRKRSGELRQYHKNYQRETWNKVLGCLKDEGLQVKGGVSKQAVKEKMKNFNAILEELLKRQCSWVVSDEQLKSELRVSISAVLVPAYRSFLGRYGQCLDAKHIKFGPEDLESRIDELFDGSTYSSHGRKR